MADPQRQIRVVKNTTPTETEILIVTVRPAEAPGDGTKNIVELYTHQCSRVRIIFYLQLRNCEQFWML